MAQSPVSIDFVQGDTLNLYFDWNTLGTGSPVDLSDVTITSSIRKEYNTDVLASFTVDMTDAATGIFSLHLSAAETAALPARSGARITSFVWDVQVVYANGDQATPVYGYLKMQRQVTL